MKNFNFEITSYNETNPFMASDKSNNGGGYKQFAIEFIYKGKKGFFANSSCGDFGTRYDLEYNERVLMWGSMYEESGQLYSTFSEESEEDTQFISDFMKWQGFIHIPSREELEAQNNEF